MQNGIINASNQNVEFSTVHNHKSKATSIIIISAVIQFTPVSKETTET